MGTCRSRHTTSIHPAPEPNPMFDNISVADVNSHNVQSNVEVRSSNSPFIIDYRELSATSAIGIPIYLKEISDFSRIILSSRRSTRTQVSPHATALDTTVFDAAALDAAAPDAAAPTTAPATAAPDAAFDAAPAPAPAAAPDTAAPDAAFDAAFVGAPDTADTAASDAAPLPLGLFCDLFNFIQYVSTALFSNEDIKSRAEILTCHFIKDLLIYISLFEESALSLEVLQQNLKKTPLLQDEKYKDLYEGPMSFCDVFLLAEKIFNHIRLTFGDTTVIEIDWCNIEYNVYTSIVNICYTYIEENESNLSVIGGQSIFD